MVSFLLTCRKSEGVFFDVEKCETCKLQRNKVKA